MDKSKFIGLSAISTNPIITNFISESPKLLEKIEYFVIDGELEAFTLRVYRRSSSKHGFFSCDNYRIINMKQVGKVRKDKEKYEKKPIPENAVEYNIAGSSVYSLGKLNKGAIKALETLIDHIK